MSLIAVTPVISEDRIIVAAHLSAARAECRGIEELLDEVRKLSRQRKTGLRAQTHVGEHSLTITLESGSGNHRGVVRG